jgi:hypothetical protein
MQIVTRQFADSDSDAGAKQRAAGVRVRVAVVLIGVLLVAAALRIHHLRRESMWIDEIASLQLSSGRGAAEIEPPADVIHQPGVDLTGLEDARPWTQVFGAVSRDTHPPLYFLLLRIWREVFGPGDSAARSLSVVCSIGCILALYDAARLLHGRSVALWTAAIMAVATPQIIFAQETRGYAMLSLFLLCAISAIARIQMLGTSMSRVAALAFSALAALLTHYTAIPALLAVTAYAIIQLRGQSRRAAIFAILGAVAVFLICWGPVFWGQRHNFTSNLAWTADDSPGLLGRTLGRLASLPIQFFITPLGGGINRPIARLGAVLYLAPLLLLRQRNLLIWVLLGGAIIGTTLTSDLAQHRKGLETLRFTVPAAPAAYVLAVAVAGTFARRWLIHVLPIIIVLGCLLSLPEAYNQFWKTDLRGLTRDLDAEAGADALLIIPYRSKDQDWASSLLLAGIEHYSKHPHRPTLALSRPISDQARAEAARSPQIWILSSGKYASIEQFLPGATVLKLRANFSDVCAKIQLGGAQTPTSPATRP